MWTLFAVSIEIKFTINEQLFTTSICILVFFPPSSQFHLYTLRAIFKTLHSLFKLWQLVVFSFSFMSDTWYIVPFLCLKPSLLVCSFTWQMSDHKMLMPLDFNYASHHMCMLCSLLHVTTKRYCFVVMKNVCSVNVWFS